MKHFVATLAVAALGLAPPVLSFAQVCNGSVTRAQVREELRQLEQAGYSPGTGEDPNYPEDIQAALARIHNGQGGSSQNSGYGSAAQGVTESGKPVPAPLPAQDIYKCN